MNTAHVAGPYQAPCLLPEHGSTSRLSDFHRGGNSCLETCQEMELAEGKYGI